MQDDQMSNKCLLVLVHKFYRDRWVTSHVVPRKGADQWASKMASHYLKLTGLQIFGGGEETAREAGQHRGEDGGDRRWRERFQCCRSGPLEVKSRRLSFRTHRSSVRTCSPQVYCGSCARNKSSGRGYMFSAGLFEVLCAQQAVSPGIHLLRRFTMVFGAPQTVSPGRHLHRMFTLFSTRRTQCGLRLECFQCALMLIWSA